jgi:integrase
VSVRAKPRHPVTGRRFTLRAASPRELDAYLHRLDSLRTELKLGVRTPAEIDRELRHLQHGPVTLERAARAYLERPGLSLNTRRGVRSLMATHLAPLLTSPLAALDAPRMGAWVEQLARAGLAQTSIGTAWRRLRAIGAYAGERGWIGAPPWGDFRPKRLGGPGRPPREAARTLAELTRLLEAASELDRRAYTGLEAKLTIAGLLGLRQGELAGLRWSDLAWGPPIVVHVARQWGGVVLKTKSAKRLESIEVLEIILRAHRSALFARQLYAVNGPVFPSPASEPGRPVHYASGEVLTRLNIRHAAQIAGLPNVASWSAHSLRDTFVTLEVAATGGDLTRVQARSRHATLSSLARYVRALSRNHPAPPAVRSLPGFDSDGAGTPFALPHHTHEPLKEQPP